MPAGDEQWERIKDLLPGGEGYEAKLKQYRAIPTRYDLPKVNWVGAIYFAVTALGIN